MQVTELIKYINNPALLDRDSVKHLQKLVLDFPYFQSAHVLLSMASKKWDTSIYQQSLKKTAIVATNRAHLFQLIHDLENAEKMQEEVVEVAAPQKQKEELLDTHKEDVQQELNILKAAEIATEPLVETQEITAEETEEPVSVKEETKPVLDAEQILEREIGKEVVNSFVEKEILKTPEFNKPPVKEEAPENFTDWLSFLKKNNGQSYQEISEQVSQEKARQESKKEIIRDVQPEKAQPESRKLKNMAIIDKIIESSPGVIRQKEDQRFYAPDIKAKESLLENEHLVTETLARIYALQGSVSKAIRAYEILSLKFPQKRAYFDGLIQKLKNNA